MAEDLVLQGTLESNSLPNILHRLYHDRETGKLTLSFLETRKSLFVKEGRIVFATSNNPDDRLGEFLLRRKLITAQQYLESAKHIRPGKKQGAVLCELGYISSENLIDLIKKQVQAIIYSLFEWTQGSYSLSLHDLDTIDLITLNFSTEDVIMRGIKRITSWSRIFGAVGGPDTVYAKTPECDSIYYGIKLKEEESHVLSSATGRTSVADICTMSYLSDFETYRLLWGFLAAGCIERIAQLDTRKVESEAQVERMVDVYNQMFAYLHDTLFQGVGEAAEDLMIQAIKDVTPQYPDLYRDVYVDASGRVDTNQFYQNLLISATARRFTMAQAALNELLYNLVFVVKRELGTDAERQVAKRLQEIKAKLPA